MSKEYFLNFNNMINFYLFVKIICENIKCIENEKMIQ